MVEHFNIGTTGAWSMPIPSRSVRRQFTAEKILIAVGGRPWQPDIPGRELGITSDEAFHWMNCPSEF